MNLTSLVLSEVAAERARQDTLWGQQDHPWRYTRDDGTPTCPVDVWFGPFQTMNARTAQKLVTHFTQQGCLSYSDILMEEVVEALDADTIEQVRTELIQVAAVCVAIVESIDRNDT